MDGVAVTEARNPNTMDIDEMDSLGICRMMNDEDQKVARAVAEVLPEVARAVDLVADALLRGGRLIYAGAGTSGRIGVLDAAECPPTFGVGPEVVTALIAGGRKAVLRAVEGVEDDENRGVRDLRRLKPGPRDVVVVLAASGRTPYSLGVLREAKRLGCATVAVTCDPSSIIAREADISIAPNAGPEVIMGSTRLKAATAQKMVVNMISTGAMIKTGRVYSNLMVDMVPCNAKLVRRAIRMVMLATGASESEAAKAFEDAGRRTKVAIVMLLAGVDADGAVELLERARGFVRKAVGFAQEGEAKR